MGYMLIAASESRDSPVDERSYSSRRRLIFPKDTQSLAMPTDWSTLGNREGWEAGKPLWGGMYRGHIRYKHCFCPWFFYFTANDTWILYLSLSASVLNTMRLRHDVCMLNWLLLGDGDIWAANYYVLSCTVLPLALNASLKEGRTECHYLLLISVIITLLLLKV